MRFIMTVRAPSQPVQVCLSASRRQGTPVSASAASPEDRKRADEAYCSVLYQYTKGPENLPYEARYMTPHPILISHRLEDEVRQFHEALAAALNNIVARWYTDKQAAFPTRMPLARHEEQLLQWLNEYSEAHPEYAYDGRQGTWRPDLLIPADEQDGFIMCEINSRFFSNGLDLATVIHRGLVNDDDDEGKPSVVQIPDNAHMIEYFYKLFNLDLPLHLVQAPEFLEGSVKARFMQSFYGWIEERTGMRPRSLRPADLRLVPDATSPTGNVLCCVLEDGGLEEIQQVGLQAVDCSDLSPDIVRHLALAATNDARSRLLVHDKRLLGILLQELDGLVELGVLTEVQARLLRSRTVPTIIPGSPDAKQLLGRYRGGKAAKNEFIIKPVRDGRGKGIKFGDELEISEWEEILEEFQTPDALSSDRETYVIQPIVEQVEDNLFLDEEIGVQRCQRVGTYYSVHGDFVGFGAWRAIVASDRVCNMGTGKAWKMGTVVPSVTEL